MKWLRCKKNKDNFVHKNAAKFTRLQTNYYRNQPNRLNEMSGENKIKPQIINTLVISSMAS